MDILTIWIAKLWIASPILALGAVLLWGALVRFKNIVKQLIS